jgi:hypothetical protein
MIWCLQWRSFISLALWFEVLRGNVRRYPYCTACNITFLRSWAALPIYQVFRIVFALFHMLVHSLKPSNSLSISAVSMIFFSFELANFRFVHTPHRRSRFLFSFISSPSNNTDNAVYHIMPQIPSCPRFPNCQTKHNTYGRLFGFNVIGLQSTLPLSYLTYKFHLVSTFHLNFGRKHIH